MPLGSMQTSQNQFPTKASYNFINHAFTYQFHRNNDQSHIKPYNSNFRFQSVLPLFRLHTQYNQSDSDTINFEFYFSHSHSNTNESDRDRSLTFHIRKSESRLKDNHFYANKYNHSHPFTKIDSLQSI